MSGFSTSDRINSYLEEGKDDDISVDKNEKPLNRSGSMRSRISMDSTRSSKSNKSVKRRSTYKPEARRKSSDLNNAMCEIINNKRKDGTIQRLSKNRKLNSSWLDDTKPRVEAPISILSFRSREYKHEFEKRKAYQAYKKSHSNRPSRKTRGVNFYPVAKYYLYFDNSVDIYYNGPIKDMDDIERYTNRFISIDFTLSQFENKFGEEDRTHELCSVEDKGINFWKSQTVEQIKDEDPTEAFFAVIEELKEMLGTPSEVEELASTFRAEVEQQLTLLSGDDNRITEDLEVVRSDEFLEAFLSFTLISFANTTLESSKFLKLFSHPILSQKESQAVQAVVELLDLLCFKSNDFSHFLESPFNHDLILALQKVTLKSLEKKMLIKVDPRKRSNLYQEGSASSRAQFDKYFSDFQYIDIFSGEQLSNEEKEVFNSQIDEKWSQVNLLDYFMNPKKEWYYQRDKWALNILKLVNGAIATSLINSSGILRDSLVTFEMPELVTEVIKTIQSQVTRLTKHFEEEIVKEEVEADEKNDVGHFLPSEYHFDHLDDHAGYNPEEPSGTFLNYLSPSSRNLAIKQRNHHDLEFFDDGFPATHARNFHYVENNAYSPWISPVVRADLHFSRRKHSCRTECSGHHGMLLLTLIRLKNDESVEFMLKNGVKANIKVCQGQVKYMEWLAGSPITSQEVAVAAARAKKKKKESGFGGALLAGRRILANLLNYSNFDEIVDHENYSDNTCHILKSHYDKVTALGVGLDTYGYGLANDTENDMKMRNILESLLTRKAKLFACNYEGVKSLLPLLDNMRKASRRLARRQDPQVYASPSVTWSSLISMKHRKKDEVVASENNVSDNTDDSVQLRGGAPETPSSNLQFFHDLDKILKYEFKESRPIVNKNKSIKLSLMVRVVLIYSAVMNRKYDLCRYLAPYAAAKENVFSDVYYIDSLTAECIHEVLEILAKAMKQVSSTQFIHSLEAFVFLMVDYNILPSKPQVLSVTSSIMAHVDCHFHLPAKSASTITSFFSSVQMKHILLLEENTFLPQRHLCRMTSTKKNRFNKAFVITKTWRYRKVKRLRRKICYMAMRARLFDLFEILFKREGPRKFSSRRILSRLTEVVCIKEDLGYFLKMPGVLETYGYNKAEISDILFEYSLEQKQGVQIMRKLLRKGHAPSLPFLSRLIHDFLFDRPMLGRIGSYMPEDRLRDLTSVLLFHEAVFKVFDIDAINNENNEERELQFLLRVQVMQDISYLLLNLGKDRKQPIWYEGLYVLLSHIMDYKLKAVPTDDQKRKDKYTELNGEVETAIQNLGVAVDDNIKWEMHWLEDEKKLVMRSCARSSTGGSKLSDYGARLASFEM